MPSDSRLASPRWSLACSSASRRICSTRVPRPDSVGRLFSSSCLLVSVSFCSSALSRCSAWRSRRWASFIRCSASARACSDWVSAALSRPMKSSTWRRSYPRRPTVKSGWEFALSKNARGEDCCWGIAHILADAPGGFARAYGRLVAPCRRGHRVAAAAAARRSTSVAAGAHWLEQTATPPDPSAEAVRRVAPGQASVHWPRKRLIACSCRARSSGSRTPSPSAGARQQHADLALVRVAVHLVRGLAGLLQRVGLRQRRVDPAERDQPVGLPRLLVVGEVAADDPLEVHPEVAVVVLVQEAARGGAGDDGAAALGDVDAGAERLPAGVLEDDVRVLAAGQLADPLAEAAPLVRVLGLLVLPEPVALGGAGR